jgi:hypothetical protein
VRRKCWDDSHGGSEHNADDCEEARRICLEAPVFPAQGQGSQDQPRSCKRASAWCKPQVKHRVGKGVLLGGAHDGQKAAGPARQAASIRLTQSAGRPVAAAKG